MGGFAPSRFRTFKIVINLGDILGFGVHFMNLISNFISSSFCHNFLYNEDKYVSLEF